MQHLNGEDAVKVLRWRKNNSGESLSVGDVGRVEVQHSFLRALAKEMVSLGTLTKIGEIVDIVDRNLESNLDYGEMIWFGERALGLKEGSIRFHNLPGDYTGTMWSPTYQNYQSYVFVNSSALRDLINQYMNPYLEDITPDMQHVVQDTTVNNLPVESDTTAQTGQAAGMPPKDRPQTKPLGPPPARAGPAMRKGRAYDTKRDGPAAGPGTGQQEGQGHPGAGDRQRNHSGRLLRPVYGHLSPPAQGAGRRRREP